MRKLSHREFQLFVQGDIAGKRDGQHVRITEKSRKGSQSKGAGKGLQSSSLILAPNMPALLHISSMAISVPNYLKSLETSTTHVTWDPGLGSLY